MTEFSFEFTNLGEFVERLAGSVVGLEVEGRDRLEKLGEQIIEDAGPLTPIGSGDEDNPGELRDSLSVEVQDDGSVRVGSFGVPYAKYDEFGTSKMRARPFMRPALARARHAFGKH